LLLAHFESLHQYVLDIKDLPKQTDEQREQKRNRIRTLKQELQKVQSELIAIFKTGDDVLRNTINKEGGIYENWYTIDEHLQAFSQKIESAIVKNDLPEKLVEECRVRWDDFRRRFFLHAQATALDDPEQLFRNTAKDIPEKPFELKMGRYARMFFLDKIDAGKMRADGDGAFLASSNTVVISNESATNKAVIEEHEQAHAKFHQIQQYCRPNRATANTRLHPVVTEETPLNKQKLEEFHFQLFTRLTRRALREHYKQTIDEVYAFTNEHPSTSETEVLKLVRQGSHRPERNNVSFQKMVSRFYTYKMAAANQKWSNQLESDEELIVSNIPEPNTDDWNILKRAYDFELLGYYRSTAETVRFAIHLKNLEANKIDILALLPPDQWVSFLNEEYTDSEKRFSKSDFLLPPTLPLEKIKRSYAENPYW
jgi:hypothetical protein